MFRQLTFEPLEDRRVLAAFTVTNLGDAPVTGAGSAPGTLRQAIYDANHAAGADLIQFAAGLSGDVNLSVVGDTTVGPSALSVTSQITIQGNANGITIRRDVAAQDMRLFLVSATGDLTFDSVMVAGGLARGDNGAPGQNGDSALGGAVYNQGASHIVASTFVDNAATGGNAGTGGIGGAGLGGAVYNDGGELSIRNATFSGDSVSSGTGTNAQSSFGGAIYSKNGSLELYNSTLTQNTAKSGRDLYIIADSAGQTTDVQIYSSIIAQADLPGLAYDFVASADGSGNLELVGANNLIRSQNAYQSIAVSSDDPLLGALANNGGPTLTHELMPGSPAIGQGSNLLNLSTDQRGTSYSRVVGGVADIGAFELQTVTPPELPGDYNGTGIVNAADYVIWRKTVGAQVSQYSGADGNGSSIIDSGDYDVWRSHFGVSTSGTSANVSAIDASNLRDTALSDFALTSPLVSHFSFFGARSEMELNSTMQFEQVTQLSPRARDQALLAIFVEETPRHDSRGLAAPIKQAIELEGPQSTNCDLSSITSALNPALLQTASPVAASTSRA
ncbi:MAG TPA: choice-of-anchor Q domain-containing protein [Lacipirellulaceae bacterium]|nr:choice-of-anchor Q domain-containing protein [Lacipirellulaceae bacterium]